jgi:hypothetical protein
VHDSGVTRVCSIVPQAIFGFARFSVVGSRRRPFAQCRAPPLSLFANGAIAAETLSFMPPLDAQKERIGMKRFAQA